MRCFTCLFIAVLALSELGCASAERAPPSMVAPVEAPLSAFEGTYDIGNGRPLWLVSDGARLVAVIGLSTYPLRRVEGDRFLNGADQTVRFEYDAAGAIVAVSDADGRYPLLVADVPERVRLLLSPRAANAPPWHYAIPQAESDIPVADAAAAGIPHAALNEVMRRLTTETENANVHSLLIYRGDHLVFEEYLYGFDADDAHDLRSATKSVHGALAGIAVREDLLTLDTPIWAELADHYHVAIDASLRRVRLRDVLDMRTGFACDDYDETSPGREILAQRADDWTEFLLRLPAAPPAAGVGQYCSMAVVSVGRLIEIRSGQDLLDYATPRLFAPLGIARERMSWDFDPTWKGSDHVSAVFLTPRDMLRFGRLYLSDGLQDGQRILPADWVMRSFDASTSVGSWRRYSRFWWTWTEQITIGGVERSFEIHAAMGNGGQRIVVLPDFDAVIVMTGGNYNERDPTRRLIAYLEQILLISGRILRRRRSWHIPRQ